jgi:chromate transporter
MFGDRVFGWRGAVAALAGLLAVPLLIVLALAALYAQFTQIPAVVGALRGMGAVAAGLVMATALKLLPTLKGHPLGRTLCAVVGVATLAAIAVLRVPLVWVVLVIGGASVLIAWWRLGRP